MAARQFVNISGVNAGGQALRGVQSVQVAEDGTVNTASGDNDQHLTGLHVGVTTYTTTITLNDLGHGVRRGNGISNINFTAHAQGPSDSDVAYTISNAKCTNRSDSPNHDSNASSVLTFQHFSFDGSTSPLSFS